MTRDALNLASGIVLVAGMVAALLAVATLCGVTRCECVGMYTPMLGARVSPSQARVWLGIGTCACWRPWVRPVSEWGR